MKDIDSMLPSVKAKSKSSYLLPKLKSCSLNQVSVYAYELPKKGLKSF